MKTVIGILLFVRHVFNFKEPDFTYVYYERLVLQDQSYLLFTWHTTNALFISSRQLRFRKWMASGSAYRKLLHDTTEIDLVIGNIWRRNKMVVAVISVPAEELVLSPFPRPVTSLRPQIQLPVPGFAMRATNARIPIPVSRIQQPSVQNLRYQL